MQTDVERPASEVAAELRQLGSPHHPFMMSKVQNLVEEAARLLERLKQDNGDRYVELAMSSDNVTHLQAQLTEANARIEAMTAGIDSLTSWLLHRFGPDSPEGREAKTCRAVLPVAVDPQRELVEPQPEVCATCLYWEASDWSGFDGLPKGTRGPHCDGSISACRANPPTATRESSNCTRSDAHWPLTGQNDWCGKYSARKLVKDETQ